MKIYLYVFNHLNYFQPLTLYELLRIYISYHLLYSINPSLCTDTTGCETCKGSIYNIVTHDHCSVHIILLKVSKIRYMLIVFFL